MTPESFANASVSSFLAKIRRCARCLGRGRATCESPHRLVTQRSEADGPEKHGRAHLIPFLRNTRDFNSQVASDDF